MPEPIETQQSVATVPDQPEAKTPLRKGMPIVIVLVVIAGLIGLANISSLVSGNKKAAPQSSLTMSPTSPDAQHVSSFEAQQQNQPKHDVEERQRQQALAKAMQELQQEQSIPSPETPGTPAMTPAQRAEIYGNSPMLRNGPRTCRRHKRRPSRDACNYSDLSSA